MAKDNRAIQTVTKMAKREESDLRAGRVWVDGCAGGARVAGGYCPRCGGKAHAPTSSGYRAVEPLANPHSPLRAILPEPRS